MDTLKNKTMILKKDEYKMDANGEYFGEKMMQMGFEAENARYSFDRKIDCKKEKRMNRNFKVGDRVRIRSWDDMVEEFGVDCGGDIEFKHKRSYFTTDRKHLCGREATISRIDSDRSVRLKDWSDNSGRRYNWFSLESLEYIEKKEKTEKEEEETMGLKEQREAFSKIINDYYDEKREELNLKHSYEESKLSRTFKYNILCKKLATSITESSKKELEAYAGEGANITYTGFVVFDKDGSRIEKIYDDQEEKAFANHEEKVEDDKNNLERERDYTLNYIKTFETANEIREYLTKQGIIKVK